MRFFLPLFITLFFWMSVPAADDGSRNKVFSPTLSDCVDGHFYPRHRSQRQNQLIAPTLPRQCGDKQTNHDLSLPPDIDSFVAVPVSNGERTTFFPLFSVIFRCCGSWVRAGPAIY